jgi:hypothetical protein
VSFSVYMAPCFERTVWRREVEFWIGASSEPWDILCISGL